MPKCLNCKYELVLLSYRRKYKCSKCGSLFLQKTIEDKTFQLLNKKQREIDRVNMKFRPKLSLEEIKRRAKTASKRWRLNNLERCKEIGRNWYKRNKAKRLAYQREWYYKNHNKILVKKRINKRLWRENNKERHIAWVRQYVQNNRNKVNLNKRLSYWRTQQSLLAQNNLKFDYPTDSFSTYGLSELLTHA